jgi:hypothetical protein
MANDSWARWRPFLATFAYFLGIGFLSGSIVHFPVGPVKFGIIAAVGVLLFVAGSILQRKLGLAQAPEGGWGRFIAGSAALSVGIGMVSGGVQHFTDFPGYAAALVPAGIVLAVASFAFRERFPADRHAAFAAAAVFVFAALLFVGLRGYAARLGPSSEDGHGHGAPASAVPVAPIDARLDVDRMGKGAGISLHLTRDGRTLGPDDFKVAHERKLHLLLAREDLQVYRHEHPEFRDGAWRVVVADLPLGVYRVFVDIAPVEGDPQVLRLKLGEGETAPSSRPVPNGPRLADGPVAADVSRSGMDLTFRLSRTDSQPLGLKPYLGALGHIVVLSHGDPEAFVHAHPLTDTPSADGAVKFMAMGLVPGRYTAFAQFDAGGAIRLFPFTFDVAADEAMSSPAGHGGMHMGH